MSEDEAADEDGSQADPSEGGQPEPKRRLRDRLPHPYVMLGAALVGLNAIIAGAVFSSMHRMEGELSRRVEPAAQAPAEPELSEAEALLSELEEPDRVALESPAEDAHAPSSEHETEPGEPAEHATSSGESPEHGAHTAESPTPGVQAAAKAGHPELSRRLLGEYLLRLDAKRATDDGAAQALADHGDFDREIAKHPMSHAPFAKVPSMGEDRIKVAVKPTQGALRVSLHANARAGVVLRALAANMGLTLNVNQGVPENLQEYPLVVEMEDRPLPRVLGALERALDVTFAEGEEYLEVLPGPLTTEALRKRAFASYRWALEDYPEARAASRIYLSLSLLREEEHDLVGMIQALRELIVTWSDSQAAIVGRLKLGRTLLGEEPSQARRFLFELLGDTKVPSAERARAGLLIGKSYLDVKDLMGAKRSLEYSVGLAREADPLLAERAEAYLSLVRVESGEFEEAVVAAVALTEATDAEAQRVAFEARARAELALGRPNRAARAAAAWVASSPRKRRSRALGYLAKALRACGRIVSAASVYQTIRVENGPGAWSEAVPEAKLLTDLGHWEQAQRILERSLAVAERVADSDTLLRLRLELARVVLELEGPVKAKPILATVALDPHTNPNLRAKAYRLLAEVATSRDDDDEALAIYTSLASDTLAPLRARREALDRRMELLSGLGRKGDAVVAARGLIYGGRE